VQNPNIRTASSVSFAFDRLRHDAAIAGINERQLNLIFAESLGNGFMAVIRSADCFVKLCSDSGAGGESRNALG
jgi:hypothetical protein